MAPRRGPSPEITITITNFKKKLSGNVEKSHVAYPAPKTKPNLDRVGSVFSAPIVTKIAIPTRPTDAVRPNNPLTTANWFCIPGVPWSSFQKHTVVTQRVGRPFIAAFLLHAICIFSLLCKHSFICIENERSKKSVVLPLDRFQRIFILPK